MLSERSQAVMGWPGDGRQPAWKKKSVAVGVEHPQRRVPRHRAHLTPAWREGRPSIAADSLRTFGITLDQIRSRVEQMIGIGPDGASPADRGMSFRAKRVLSLAEEEAARGNHPPFEPEHLLLGFGSRSRRWPLQVLRDLHAPPEVVCERVRGRWAWAKRTLATPDVLEESNHPTRFRPRQRSFFTTDHLLRGSLRANRIAATTRYQKSLVGWAPPTASRPTLWGGARCPTTAAITRCGTALLRVRTAGRTRASVDGPAPGYTPNVGVVVAARQGTPDLFSGIGSDEMAGE